MSTLKVTNIQDTSGGNNSTSAEIYNGRVKAWVNFNGTGTVSIRSDYNVNTITDNGTGVYSINFTTAMTDANYSVVGSNVGSVHASYACFVCADNAANTTSSCDIEMRNGANGSIYDQPSINIIVCR